MSDEKAVHQPRFALLFRVRRGHVLVLVSFGDPGNWTSALRLGDQWSGLAPIRSAASGFSIRLQKATSVVPHLLRAVFLHALLAQLRKEPEPIVDRGADVGQPLSFVESVAEVLGSFDETWGHD